jgi:hypothetical protein
MQKPVFPGLFDNYPRSGRDWLRRLPREERVAFSYIGRAYADHGRAGGRARAATAQRNARGQFTKETDHG